jgi:negative regulator of sigma-B (phosphoserine phosphatase)
MRTDTTCGAFHWSVASRPMPGHWPNGDLHRVREYRGGVLLAVADGLGHGAEAYRASQCILTELEASAEQGLEVGFARCNQAGAPTRGAALSAAWVRSRTGAMEWSGVGNVEGVVRRARTGGLDRVLLKGGVVGHHLPALRICPLVLTPGDTVAFATDGIAPDFSDEVDCRRPPGELAEALLERFSLARDDALVLVARFEREP